MPMCPDTLSPSENSSVNDRYRAAGKRSAVRPLPSSDGRHVRAATAIVYCQGHFGAIDGKTADRLVRHSAPCSSIRIESNISFLRTLFGIF